MHTHYIGLDLAWSPRNLTGAVVLASQARGATLVSHTLLGDDDVIEAFVLANAGADATIVAVDAPLQVPNETGRRPAEAELATHFARYQAGPHPANRQRLLFNGVVRGEALVERLARHGFVYEPLIAPSGPPRQVAEVFPHPATIALFGLARTLKYKAKPKRTIEQRLAAFRDYQAHLLQLSEADPPLQGHAAFLSQEVGLLRGQRLKNYEDQLDALLCAYIALYGQRWGLERCRVFGNNQTGAIFTPVPLSVLSVTF